MPTPALQGENEKLGKAPPGQSVLLTHDPGMIAFPAPLLS